MPSFHYCGKYLRSILVFKALNNLAPNYIRTTLTMSNDIHNAAMKMRRLAQN